MATPLPPRLYAGTAGHSAWFSDDLGDTWTHPNSHSGMYTEARVWALSSHPSDPQSLYAGSDMGIFRWDEGSARWELLPSPMQDVWAVAQDPEDARVHHFLGSVGKPAEQAGLVHITRRSAVWECRRRP